MNDIHLFYYGASGGFCALWTILLGTDYRCIFKQDFDSAFDSNWDIKNVSTWKKTEQWPDNELTLQSDIDKKIYFYCNPRKEVWNQSVGLKIVLYTDVYTQIYFAHRKNAFYFLRNTLEHWRNKLKLLEDPKITDDEFLHRMAAAQARPGPGWPTDVLYPPWPPISQNVKGVPAKYNDMEIHNRLLTEIDINAADIAITLQSIIKTQGSSILIPLGFDTNDKCVSFLDHYKSLHTDDMIKHLLVENKNSDPY